ncbi:MAG: Mini-ribonuclease 3 [Clostridiales bacterium]|nr:Mini-ribonuclease 3 [Clostridiales bacterium]
MEIFFESLDLNVLAENELRSMSSQKFAYIGDVVYELYIRNYALVVNKHKINEINRFVVKYVKASSQAHAILNMKEYLTEEEWEIVKWGRNQKTTSSPKNAVISEYKYATGFETLVGSLYLRQDKKRLEEIVSQAITLINQLGA